MDPLDALRSANAAYYAAFESQDLEAMAAVWERSERTVCTHPGWPTIKGTFAILRSYAAIFRGPQSLQVILTNERPVAEGTLGYVTVDENLVDQDGRAAATAALNLFRFDGEGWHMVGHHGSPIVQRPSAPSP